MVKTLAKNNLAFREENEKIGDENNDNFLGIIEMIGEFDPFMKEHIWCLRSNEIHYDYLSQKIQNEFIEMSAKEIKSFIIKNITVAQHYAMILDCTFDTSHEEQTTLIIRCVSIAATLIKVEELF